MPPHVPATAVHGALALGRVTMGAPKIRCRDCGAKNDTSSRRCRVCASLINLNVPEPGKSNVDLMNAPGSGSQGPDADHFDAGAIAQQMQPKSAMFKKGGGLSGRIAAATGAAPVPAAPSPDTWAVPPTPAGDQWSGSDDSFSSASFGPSSSGGIGPQFEPQSFGPPPSENFGQSFEPQSFEPQSFEPQSFEPQSFEPQSFGPSPSESFGPSFEPQSFEPVSFGADETFDPQAFSIAAPDLPPPLVVEEERFDPNALFRDEPGAF